MCQEYHLADIKGISSLREETISNTLQKVWGIFQKKKTKYMYGNEKRCEAKRRTLLHRKREYQGGKKEEEKSHLWTMAIKMSRPPFTEILKDGRVFIKIYKSCVKSKAVQIILRNETGPLCLICQHGLSSKLTKYRYKCF